MAAVPHATSVGFTGTPIAKTEQGEGTFKIFGKDDERGYLDKYSIAESIEDGTTLPIKHVVAHELLHLRVPNHGRLFKALMSVHVPGWRSLELRR